MCSSFHLEAATFPTGIKLAWAGSLWVNTATMKLVKFTGGTVGVPVWINPDAVSSVQADFPSNGKMTIITTLDGQEHRVQEDLATVVNNLQ